MAFPNYNGEYLLFVYSKKHDDTPREQNRFRYEIPTILPKFKVQEYTSAIIIGKQFNPETAEYFEVFDDSVVLGIGTIDDCEVGL